MKTTRVVHEVLTEVLCPYCGSNQFVTSVGFRTFERICADCGKFTIPNVPAAGDLKLGAVVSEKLVGYRE